MKDVENLFNTAFNLLKMEIDLFKLNSKEKEEILTLYLDSRKSVDTLIAQSKTHEQLLELIKNNDRTQ